MVERDMPLHGPTFCKTFVTVYQEVRPYNSLDASGPRYVLCHPIPPLTFSFFLLVRDGMHVVKANARGRKRSAREMLDELDYHRFRLATRGAIKDDGTFGGRGETRAV
jgi:hypothetical protein